MTKSRGRNKFERRIWNWLKKKKAIFSYEGQKIPYVIASHYTPDFIIQTKLGKVYVEAKGYLRREDKRKLLAVKRQHPNLDIRLLFYSSSPSNIRWATKSGFKYAVETIPSPWLTGEF